MTYFLLSIVLAELVVIVALAARLKATLEAEKYLSGCEAYRDIYYQARLDDVVNDYEDSLKDMFKKKSIAK